MLSGQADGERCSGGAATAIDWRTLLNKNSIATEQARRHYCNRRALRRSTRTYRQLLSWEPPAACRCVCTAMALHARQHCTTQHAAIMGAPPMHGSIMAPSGCGPKARSMHGSLAADRLDRGPHIGGLLATVQPGACSAPGRHRGSCMRALDITGTQCCITVMRSPLLGRSLSLPAAKASHHPVAGLPGQL